MDKIIIAIALILFSMFIVDQDERVNSLQNQVIIKDLELMKQREMIKQLNNEIVLYQDLEQLKDELGKYQKGLKN